MTSSSKPGGWRALRMPAALLTAMLVAGCGGERPHDALSEPDRVELDVDLQDGGPGAPVAETEDIPTMTQLPPTIVRSRAVRRRGS